MRYVAFHAPRDYGTRIRGAGTGLTLERNLAVDALDTGHGYTYVNGISSAGLPTGTNISFGTQSGLHRTPVVQRDWTCHTDPDFNAIPLSHFSRLCEYG